MMSSNTIHRSHASGPSQMGAKARLARPLRLLAVLAVTAWRRQRDEKLLQELSDHQLRDLGIGRGDIHRVTREGRGW